MARYYGLIVLMANTAVSNSATPRSNRGEPAAPPRDAYSASCHGYALAGDAFLPRSSLEWAPPCHGGDREFKSHR